MEYILIMMLNYSNIETQTFKSKDTCQNAMLQIKLNFKNKKLKTICVKK